MATLAEAEPDANGCGPADDLALVQQVREGAPDAFGALIERHRDRLHGIVRALARDHADAQDVVSEAVLRTWRHLDHFRPGRFSTWFLRIGANQAVSAARRVRRRREILDAGTTRPDPRTPAPDAAVVLAERSRLLRGAVSRLPRRMRRVVLLRYRGELEVREIARRLEATPNAVSLLLFKARRRLREDLAARLG